MLMELEIFPVKYFCIIKEKCILILSRKKKHLYTTVLYFISSEIRTCINKIIITFMELKIFTK